MSVSVPTQRGTVAVIGLGYVGLPLAVLTARKGYRVIGVDISKERVNLIRHGKTPFADNTLVKELTHTPLEATNDFQRITEASIVVLCVPTPVYSNHMPDLRPVEAACKSIAPFLQKDQLIISSKGSANHIRIYGKSWRFRNYCLASLRTVLASQRRNRLLPCSLPRAH